MGKRKQESESDVEEEAASEDYSPKAKPKAKRAPAAKKPTPAKKLQESTDESGWTTKPPSLIYKTFGSALPSTKVAALDLDGTLVNQKSMARFAVNEDDWKLFNKQLPAKLKEFHDQGYKLVIFSNQNGIKSALTGKMAIKTKARIDNVVKAIGLPVQVFLATQQDENRKPDKGMWEFFVRECNGGVVPDLDSSFYVGDAAGRPADFAASDKEFAANVGIPFKVPEDVFGPMEGKAKTPVPTGPVEGGGLNPGLVDAFTELSECFAALNDHFKKNAFKKVSIVLSSYGSVITHANLKDVGKLPGVGKSSLNHIKEYLDTGKIAVIDELKALPEAAAAAPAQSSKAAKMAANFM